jgi:Leucine-rich repeat (LRR) protein
VENWFSAVVSAEDSDGSRPVSSPLSPPFEPFPNLQILDLSGQNLTVLPQNLLGGLQDLFELNLRENKIATVPLEIVNDVCALDKNFTKLDLVGNPLRAEDLDEKNLGWQTLHARLKDSFCFEMPAYNHKP